MSNIPQKLFSPRERLAVFMAPDGELFIAEGLGEEEVLICIERDDVHAFIKRCMALYFESDA